MNRTGEKNSRGRPWDKDEIILALNAYLSGVKDSKSEPKFIKLCEFLDRSFNSVRARFGNFIHLDPKHSGQGLSAASRLVKLQEAWDEFANDPARLKSKAAAIRRKRIRAKQNQKPGRSQKSKRKVSIAVAPEGKPLPRSHTGRGAKLWARPREKRKRPSRNRSAGLRGVRVRLCGKIWEKRRGLHRVPPHQAVARFEARKQD